MPTRVFLVLALAFGGLAFCAPPAKAECRTEAGFTACPKDEFAKLMEKLATARGDAKTCDANLAEAKGKLEDAQAALAQVPTVEPVRPRSRLSFALGVLGGALIATAPWLSGDTGRTLTASAGIVALGAGWLASE